MLLGTPEPLTGWVGNCIQDGQGRHDASGADGDIDGERFHLLPWCLAKEEQVQGLRDTVEGGVQEVCDHSVDSGLVRLASGSS